MLKFIMINYALGLLILPFGDISILRNLCKLYLNRKKKEQHDLDQFDFITNHILNNNGFFDAHNNGDEQKPPHTNPHYPP